MLRRLDRPIPQRSFGLRCSLRGLRRLHPSKDASFEGCSPWIGTRPADFELEQYLGCDWCRFTSPQVRRLRNEHASTLCYHVIRFVDLIGWFGPSITNIGRWFIQSATSIFAPLPKALQRNDSRWKCWANANHSIWRSQVIFCCPFLVKRVLSFASEFLSLSQGVTHCHLLAFLSIAGCKYKNLHT